MIHALIAAGGQDEEWLTTAQLNEGHVRIPAEHYRRWTDDLSGGLMEAVTEAWGEAPGKLFVNDSDEIVLATIQAGNVVLLIQPPRGFGENPIAIYHDPALALPPHLAAYRGSACYGSRGSAPGRCPPRQSRAMEWLPGRTPRLSPRAPPRGHLRLPLVYPSWSTTG